MSQLYKQCLTLQRELDASSAFPEIRDEILSAGLEAVNTEWTKRIKRIAHSTIAYFLEDGLTMDSYLNPVQQYGEVIVKGSVPRISCIDIAGRYVLSLPFYAPTVLGPKQEIEPELIEYELDEDTAILPLDVELRRPLHLPVENLQNIMLAA